VTQQARNPDHGARWADRPAQVVGPAPGCHVRGQLRHPRSRPTDWILVWNRRHLEWVLRASVDHYNLARPTAGSASRSP